MSEKELASVRSFWKRREFRAGRRSRYVEVREVSLETVRADAVENGLVDDVVAVLGTGKEANVYVGLWKDSPLALKVYRLHSTPHKKKSTIGYAQDRMGAIAAREFTILLKAYRAGVPVPTPARRVDNMFTMRFLGDMQAAPLLKDSLLEDPQEVATQALALVRKLFDACIVHGDLSEYNLVHWQGQLFVIDFPQAVDFSSRVDRHTRLKEAGQLLLRDLTNLEDYFAKYGVEMDSENEYSTLMSRHGSQSDFETEPEELMAGA
ncbi:MAG TPA: RIO1 family regulatory kinase/ATPase [Candidatus Bathyarchaeia archaeon]|nr:RIO1 family regulatory kinase/ATPase [Candidatus Bathyarchaeia archaeon]